MQTAEKLKLVDDMSQAVRELALAGIQQRHPGISERECFLRLMLLTVGPDLARRAYPEIDERNIVEP